MAFPASEYEAREKKRCSAAVEPLRCVLQQYEANVGKRCSKSYLVATPLATSCHCTLCALACACGIASSWSSSSHSGQRFEGPASAGQATTGCSPPHDGKRCAEMKCRNLMVLSPVPYTRLQIAGTMVVGGAPSASPLGLDASAVGKSFSRQQTRCVLASVTIG